MPGERERVAKMSICSDPPIEPESKVRLIVEGAVAVTAVRSGGDRVGFDGAVDIEVSAGARLRLSLKNSWYPDGLIVSPNEFVVSQSPVAVAAFHPALCESVMSFQLATAVWNLFRWSICVGSYLEIGFR